MILPNALQSPRPRFATEKAAWQWIATELNKSVARCAIPRDRCNGLCLVLMWMGDCSIISWNRKNSMKTKLYRRFAPRERKGEQGDGPFFWKRGVRQPRVMAAQLMSILSRG